MGNTWKADNYKGSGMSKGAYLRSKTKAPAKTTSKSSSSKSSTSSIPGRTYASNFIGPTLPQDTRDPNTMLDSRGQGYSVAPQNQATWSNGSSSGSSGSSSNKSSSSKSSSNKSSNYSVGKSGFVDQSNPLAVAAEQVAQKQSSYTVESPSAWSKLKSIFGYKPSSSGKLISGGVGQTPVAQASITTLAQQQPSTTTSSPRQYTPEEMAMYTEMGIDPTTYDEMGVSDEERYKDIENEGNRQYDLLSPEEYSAMLSGSAPTTGSAYASGALADSMLSEQQYANKMGSTIESASDQMAKRKKQYGDRYDFLSGQIGARLPLAQNERQTALSGMDAEMENLTAKADIGKQNIESQYADTEENLKDEKARLDQDLARIFEGRNVMDSSYFIKEQQKSNDKFLVTLEKLGGEKGRTLAAYDADITYYQKQAVDKRSKIEQAYNQTIQKINEDLTKTQFEREDALQALDTEFQTKMDTIDNNIMEFSMKQQEFRQGVQQWYATHAADFAADAEAQRESARQKQSPMIKQYMAMGFTLEQAAKLAGEEVSSSFNSPKPSQGDIDTSIRQDLLSPEGQSMTDEEKMQYIISQGGNPADFGYYPNY